jgi:hypothetical protein
MESDGQRLMHKGLIFVHRMSPAFFKLMSTSRAVLCSRITSFVAARCAAPISLSASA